jgi:hypothetical protein
VEARKRIPPAEDIRAEFNAGASHGFGRLLDISDAGVFVRSALLPPRGPVYMVLRTPSGREIRVAGEVRWNTAGKHFRASGFGVRLNGPGRDYRALLTRARELQQV